VQPFARDVHSLQTQDGGLIECFGHDLHGAFAGTIRVGDDAGLEGHRDTLAYSPFVRHMSKEFLFGPVALRNRPWSWVSAQGIKSVGSTNGGQAISDFRILEAKARSSAAVWAKIPHIQPSNLMANFPTPPV
jgi:hypothetical protein